MNNYCQGKSIDISFSNKQQVFIIAAGLYQGYEENKDEAMPASKAVDAIAEAFDLNLNAALCAILLFEKYQFTVKRNAHTI